VVRVVLFDIDGTLARTSGAGVKAFAKVFKTLFNAVDGFEKLKFAGRTDISLIREFFAVHNIPPTKDNFERFCDDYVFWLEHILQDSVCEVCPGVWDLIHGLNALEQPPLLGLLTGNIQLGAEIKLRHLGLWQEFTMGGFADDNEDRDKIAAAARDRVGRILGTKPRPEEIVVIGDTPLDVKCGRAIGAKVLAVATGGASLEELQRHKPDWAVPDLRQIDAKTLTGSNGAPLGKMR
jgi:phosphoglycolate phosphatase